MSNYKEAVRAVVTVNVALTGLPSADKSDDVTLVANDRVVLIAQTAPEENGLWEVDTGAWSRPADSASTSNVESAAIVFVEEGTRYKSAGFVLQNPNPIVVDTDPQTWFCFTRTGLPPGWLNVRDFGAVGDGTTDDSAAFAAAFSAFPGAYYTTTQVDGTLYVPPGTYKLDEDLWVSRGVRMLGAAGSGDYTSKLLFKEYKGIFVVNPNLAPDFNDAGGAIFESLYISGGHRPGEPLCHWMHDTWEAETEYEPTDKIVQFAPRDLDDPIRRYQTVDHYYECIRAGTSGATEPNWIEDDYGITDAPTLTQWIASTPYNSNAVVWVEDKYDIVFFPASQPFENVTSGTNIANLRGATLGGGPYSDGVIDWMPYPAAHFLRGDLHADPAAAIIAGEPLWIVRKNAGIRALRRCKIIDCYIDNFLNTGVDLAASGVDAPLYENTNGAQLSNLQIRACGGGVLTQFRDSGASLFQGVDISGARDFADPIDTSKEFGIYDRAQFGSTFIGTQIAQVGGPHIFQTDPISTSVYAGCYTEQNNGPALMLSPSVCVPGGLVLPVHKDSLAAGIFAPGDWRGVGANLKFPASGGVTASSVLADTSYGSYTLTANDNTGVFGWIYNLATNGTWSLLGDNTLDKVAFNLTTMRSQSATPFMVAFPRGYFLGPDAAHEMLVTPGGDTAHDFNIRGGRRIVGDRNIDATLVKPNTFLESVVIEDGYRGPAGWTPDIDVNSLNRGVTYLSNDSCIEVNGYVYRCANSGRTDAVTEPDWPEVPTAYPGIQVWNGGFNSSSTFGGCYKHGDYVRPITPNGFVYQCNTTNEGVGGVLEGQVGSVEPTWATTLMDFNALPDGQVTWQCIGVDDNSSFVDDNTAVWVCQGKVPTYGKANFIHHQGTALLEADVAPVTGVIDLGPLPNDQMNVYRVTVRAQNIAEDIYAYFELKATWSATSVELEAPDEIAHFPSSMINGITAELFLNTGSNRVEVAIGHDGTEDITFTAIRAIF